MLKKARIKEKKHVVINFTHANTVTSFFYGFHLTFNNDLVALRVVSNMIIIRKRNPRITKNSMLSFIADTCLTLDIAYLVFVWFFSSLMFLPHFPMRNE